MDVIIYHAHCPDGFCAAFIAKKRFPEAELVGLDHGNEPPYDLVRGKDVLVVDFSWRTREQNIEMHRLAKSLRILDHHKTAQAELEGLDFATFDMQRSGAGLTWDYLFGYETFNTSNFDKPVLELHSGTSHSRPWYVCYVEDRDLWRHALPHSKEVNAFLMTLPLTVDAWDGLYDLDAEDAEISGEGALAQVEHYVREAVLQAQPGTFFGHSCKVVNALYLNCSEIGNELAQTADVSITWFERKDGQIQFSLRSQGDIDVSEMAKTYKGGGHMHAAGFSLPLVEGRRLLDIILGRENQVGDITEMFLAIQKLPPGAATKIMNDRRARKELTGLRAPDDAITTWIDTLDV